MGCSRGVKGGVSSKAPNDARILHPNKRTAVIGRHSTVKPRFIGLCIHRTPRCIVHIFLTPAEIGSPAISERFFLPRFTNNPGFFGIFDKRLHFVSFSNLWAAKITKKKYKHSKDFTINIKKHLDNRTVKKCLVLSKMQIFLSKIVHKQIQSKNIQKERGKI